MYYVVGLQVAGVHRCTVGSVVRIPHMYDVPMVCQCSYCSTDNIIIIYNTQREFQLRFGNFFQISKMPSVVAVKFSLFDPSGSYGEDM